MPALEPTGDVKQAEVAAITAGSNCQVAGPRGPNACEGTGQAARRRAALYALLRRPRFWAGVVLLVSVCAAGFALAEPQLRAMYHLRAARSDLQCYHNPQAIRHLQACLRVWPANAEVLLLSARAARRAGAYDEAERGLEKYRQVRGLDDAGSFEQLLLSAERGVEQVARVCRRHVEQGHPDAPLILEALTRGYLRQYRLPEARLCLDLWLRSQPDNPQASCLKGQFHLDYERAPDRAVESYRRAVQLDPDHEEARLGLAVVLLESKSFAAAVEHLEYLRQCQPHNLRVQVGLAQCRNFLGEADEALRLVEDVLARQPEFAPALGLRGELAIANGQYVDGERWLRRAVILAPSDHQARYNLILSLYHNGRPDEAIRHEQALRQWEDDVKRFNHIVTKEMPNSPEDPDLHSQLGQLLLRSGHYEEGVRWLHSALRLEPGYPPARQALAEYYQKVEAKDDQATK